MRALEFDGIPFIVTTDGSKDAFAGILSQKTETTAPGGRRRKIIHPIGYVSKQTSRTED